LVPVAQEFSSASREGFFGSEPPPSEPECPSTTIESGYPGVLTGAVVVEVVTPGLAEGAVLPPEEHAARARIGRGECR